ncbi:MAG: FliM/FliN family flagellar motor switch protein [Candidatus Caenarcaniphilales bacterium]|nr:FliM/FliN family flagellar motor switch protein [Candidatus Caenarcaniphilales bacterium]
MPTVFTSKSSCESPLKAYGSTEYGINNELNNLLNSLDWENLNLNPISVLRQFFELSLKGKFVGVFQELDSHHWKGLATKWSVWEDSKECQLRIDKNLALLLLSKSLGSKGEDHHFSCKSMTNLETEVLEGAIQELVEHITTNVENLEIEESSSDFKGELAHMVWAIDGERSISKIAISLPIERVPQNSSYVQREAIRTENDCSQATIKLSLHVGSSQMTLADLAKLEKEDFIFLEESDKNCLKILGMDELDPDFSYSIPIVIGPRKIDSKWHKIKLEDSNIQEIKKDMNQALSSDVLRDFPVDVKAEFKDVKMTLKDLFALQSGWVLPIEQIADNELLLTSQGKTIARGELVVTGNKFGVLIKEVLLNESNE